MDCLFCEPGWADLRGLYIIYFWLKEYFNIEILFGNARQDRCVYDTNFQTMYSERAVCSQFTSHWVRGGRWRERKGLEFLRVGQGHWLESENGGSALWSYGLVLLPSKAVIRDFKGPRSFPNITRGVRRKTDSGWLQRTKLLRGLDIFSSNSVPISAHPGEAELTSQTVWCVFQRLMPNAWDVFCSLPHSTPPLIASNLAILFQ